jgi:L-ascorbate metabolism protein UlaG (beta-lactamase superfamily)
MLELGYATPDTPDFTCSYRIYISGDTFATKKLQEVARRYEGQPIDLMLAHLGGTTFPSFLAGRIMEPLASTIDIDAEDCLKVIQLIKPELTIPIHYVDFDVFRISLEDFQRLVEAVGLSDKVLVLDRGDEYRFHVRG